MCHIIASMDFTLLLNITSKHKVEVDVLSIWVQVLLILPECVNIICLLLGLYGMYHGIEIQHPLYAILFVNLIVACATSVLDLLVFIFIRSERYLIFSNLMNNIGIMHHCSCWCVSSILRFIYIVYDDWFHSHISSIKLQCTLAIICEQSLALFFGLPALGVVISFGK